MTPEELSAWTPIALTWANPEPIIDWCDLRGIPFSEPFFLQTIQRWTAGEAPRPVVRTGLSALLDADAYGPCLEPSGFIFQMSRCGSTLVSRLLGCKTGTLVVSEPDPINTLLAAGPDRIPRTLQVQCLRLLIRALGRCRLGGERHYVIKFSSWAINRLSLLKEAFPEVPWVWIYRDPAAVLASVLAGPPGWMQLRFQPRLAESLLGITNLSCAASPQSFATQALANFSAAALAGTDGAQPFVNYRSLPEAIWQTVAPTFHMDLDADDVIAMKAEASWSAHEVSRTPFVPGARPSGSLPAPSPLLEGLYQEMEAHAKKRHDHSRI